MTHLRKLLAQKEIFIRLFLLSSTCTMIVCTLIIGVIVARAQNTYTKSYIQSNDIVLQAIEKDYTNLLQNINQVFEYLDNQPIIEQFLTEDEMTAASIIDLNRELSDMASLFQNIPSSLVLIGTNGRTFYQDNYVSKYPASELLASDLMASFNETAALNQVLFLNGSLISESNEEPSIIYSRKLTDGTNVYGYALFFIKESQFSAIYTEKLDRSLHQTTILNHDEVIVSSTLKETIGTHATKTDFQGAQTINLGSYPFVLYDTINESVLIKRMNIIQLALIVWLLGLVFSFIFSFFLFKKVTSPIYMLIDKISNITEDNFSNQIEIAGTYETKQLGNAYNLMLENINSYIDNLIRMEKENHLIKIKNLQMQIHPHFIYNTLTAIKVLIWQNQNAKAEEAIQSFIHLMQKTFDKREAIPLGEELKISQDYVNLLRIRYGERIQTTFYSDDTYHHLLLPKLIIQPIIENCYIHAFPQNQNGIVSVFTRVHQDILYIEIIDNGVGFNQTTKKHEHFSSIGIENIDYRLKLLYGDDYGAFIESQVNQGTVVTIKIPAQQAEPASDL
ncbi:sensor histidine kinase [Enterococcus aquimarinus]|nr:histidine kinase [Enterococcus aquimarinus]